MTETEELLGKFVREGSETAFQELVRLYMDLVYSVAMRRVSGDAHQAQDVVQTVFTDLARKAATLPAGVMLGGWLHRHCCFVASNISRTESRRKKRESEAMEIGAADVTGGEAGWEDLAPAVDEAILELDQADRDALVLRYYEQRPLRSVGEALGVSEDTAQKRVARAVEKLRGLLAQRGITLGVAALGGMLEARAIIQAPVGWARDVGAKALEKAGYKTAAVATGAGLLAGFWFKAAAVMLGAGLLVGALVWNGKQGEGGMKELAEAKTEQTASLEMPVNGEGSGNAEGGGPTNGPTTAAEESTGLFLAIQVVAADAGEAIPNVPLELRAWANGKFKGKKLTTDRFGKGKVPLPEGDVESVQITSRVEGFADTRLLWWPKRGEKVPESYTLKLERAVPIGGWVRDEHGTGISGAKVGFNLQESPNSSITVQSHEFGWIEVETDGDGRWEINRMADEVIRNIYGGAKHEDYLNASVSVNAEALAEEALRAKEYVFTLIAALKVSGVVVDEEGRPISGAALLLGSFGSSASRRGKSGVDGRFELSGAIPGKNVVTAEAEGFAPTTVEWAGGGGGDGIRIQLRPGKTLRLRVVDKEGRGVPGAHLWLDTLNSGRDNDKAGQPLLQAEYNPTTDLEGRATWTNAPDQELRFDASAEGFMRVSGFKVRPDENEHVIVIPKGLRIRGTVRDAATGRLLDKIRVVTGWPSRNFQTGEVSPRWSTIDRFWMSYSGGVFEHLFEEPVIGGAKEIEFVFKIEADGYAPEITRVVKAEEEEVQFEVALKKSDRPALTVLLPDGKPAGRTDVGVATPRQRVELIGNGFPAKIGGWIMTTDAQGKVYLEPGNTTAWVFAANSAGFAAIPPEELAANPEIRLQRWGRVHGIISRGGEPISDVKVYLKIKAGGGTGPGFSLATVRTDQAGEYEFSNVPPGKGELIFLGRPLKSGAFPHLPSKELEVVSGGSTEVNP